MGGGERRILIAGESWVTHAIHQKGFDSFTTTSYHEGVGPLRAALESGGFTVDFQPSHVAASAFPSTAAELAHVLAHPNANGLHAVVVDLSGVDYINGAGLQVFEKTAALLNQVNVDLLVCGLQPAVQAAFDLAGTMPNLAIMASRDAALLRYQRPPGES